MSIFKTAMKVSFIGAVTLGGAINAASRGIVMALRDELKSDNYLSPEEYETALATIMDAARDHAKVDYHGAVNYVLASAISGICRLSPAERENRLRSVLDELLQIGDSVEQQENPSAVGRIHDAWALGKNGREANRALVGGINGAFDISMEIAAGNKEHSTFTDMAVLIAQWPSKENTMAVIRGQLDSMGAPAQMH